MYGASMHPNGKVQGARCRVHGARCTVHGARWCTVYVPNTSGLSPMPRTFDISCAMLMPESASNNAGTCAAILVTSPVILCTPAESPLPVETTVILSTLL